MSAEFTEYHRRLTLWEQTGDTERLAVHNRSIEASVQRETNPEQAFNQYNWCRDEARRLGDLWLELYSEHFRLDCLVSGIKDFTRASPLAVELMVRFNSPTGRVHESWNGILDNALFVYVNIDPIGYRREIEEGLAYLDGQIPREPDHDRFGLSNSQLGYLTATERWDEAYDLALRSLALIDKLPDSGARVWYTCWTLHYLCPACHALGRTDELGGHASLLASLTPLDGRLQKMQVEAALWQAILHRTQGKAREAANALHRGLRRLKSLSQRDSACADPLACYYEASGALAKALGVRDRELAEIRPRGALHRSCQVQIERCRLLGALGKLTTDDLAEARRLAGELRAPEWFAAKIDRLDPLKSPRTDHG